MDFDVLIIGSGPGGHVAAIKCAQLGKSVAVIERDRVGGVCLNMGCIPSKTLIRQASLFRAAGDLESLGVMVDRSGFDYAKVFAASRKAADTLSRGVAYLFKKNKIILITGTGRLVSAHEVAVDDRIFAAENIIIATGSRPKTLAGFPVDEELVLSSDGALMLQRLPKKIIILGAGAIGAEFSFVMTAFGVEVHLVEAMDRVLPLEDGDVSETVRRSFVKQGINISTGVRAVSLQKDAGRVALTIEDAEKNRAVLEADKLLVAVGRTPNTAGIGLEEAGVALDRGFITVGEYGETSVKGIHAIGDVVATPLLAHVASKEGEIAAEHIAGLQPGRLDLLAVPNGVYCEPEVASFGLTALRAQELGVPVKTSSFLFRACGKAIAAGETEGFVKLVHDPAGSELLGAHIVGAHATELIHELLLAKTQKLPLSAIADMIHAHPTLAEASMEAARMAGGRGIMI